MNTAAAATVYLELPTPIQTQLHRTSLRLLQGTMYTQLPGNLKLLLHTLCMHHNDQTGYAWPSVERLARLCSTSVRTVQRNLGQLVQQGMVVIGRVPGLRSNAYVVQEATLHAMALPQEPAPVRAPSAEQRWLQPTVVFAATAEAPPLPATPATHDSNPDTHVTQTEVNESELKKTGEEEKSPESTAEQAALTQVNAQRQRNGKRALSRADTHNMEREAQRAHLTPLQALQWVLARPSRNFFKAEYANAAGGDVCGGVGLGTTQPTGANAHNGGRTQPNNAPDLDTQALFARQARAQEAKAAASAQSPAIEPNAAPLLVAGQSITGPAWATSAARQFCAGVPVSLFRIQAACSVLGVSRQALRQIQANQPLAL